MPRYYFHVFDDGTCLDEEGQELPDLESARAHAVQGARSLMSDTLKLGRLVLSHHIAIQNDRGEQLLDVTFADAVEVSSRPPSRRGGDSAR